MSFCLFPCQEFIDEVSSPVAQAAFDLQGEIGFGILAEGRGRRLGRIWNVMALVICSGQDA